MRDIILSQNTTAQSIGFDEINGWFYVPQIIQDNVQLPDEPAPVPYATRLANGDCAINRLSLDGTVDSVMYVRGSGHGVSAAVNSDGRLWLDADASGSGFARALSLTAFQPGAVLDSDNLEIFRPFGPPSGSHGLSCSIDLKHGLFAVRRTFPDPSDGRRHYLYRLQDAQMGNFDNVLHTIDQAANQPPDTPGAIGTSQGFCTFGDFMYSLEGSATEYNTYISRLSWLTGMTEQKVFIGVMSDLKIREPEGITVYRKDLNNELDDQLVFGLDSGVDNGKIYNLAYIPRFAPIAVPNSFGRSTYGSGGYGQ